jgi:hypothetical protein
VNSVGADIDPLHTSIPMSKHLPPKRITWKDADHSGEHEMEYIAEMAQKARKTKTIPKKREKAVLNDKTTKKRNTKSDQRKVLKRIQDKGRKFKKWAGSMPAQEKPPAKSGNAALYPAQFFSQISEEDGLHSLANAINTYT